ncbi:MAG: Toluene tolerance precursor [Myxococcales bacterium]|nr:Toluene tolerance precursor [Myxococcales bacterium]
MKRALILSMILAASALPAFAGPDTAAKPAEQKLAKPGPGTQSVKSANEKIASLLKQKAAAGSKEEKVLATKVTTSVRDFLDIDELGKRALVDKWAKLTPAQQTEFLTTLRSLIEDNYVHGLRSNLEYSIDYAGETADKDGSTIVTTWINTKRHNRPYKIEVDYVLKRDGDKLKAWDVKTDGVGLVENYRTQFNKIIDRDGFGGLIAKMKKKQGATGT